MKSIAPIEDGIARAERVGHSVAFQACDTPERFAKLTGHLRVNGKPLVSRIFEREKEKQG